MTAQINYKTNFTKKNSGNEVLFVDENFSISSLKRYITNSEYALVSDLLKIKDKKKKIISYDVSSMRKIILVSTKKNITNSEAENLGAKFFNLFKDSKQNI